MKWCYHVYDHDNKEVKKSEYIYDTEEAAIADGAYYAKNLMPAGVEPGHVVASWQRT